MNKKITIFALGLTILIIISSITVITYYSPTTNSLPPLNSNTLKYYSEINTKNSETYYKDISTPCIPQLITYPNGSYWNDWGFCGKANVVLTTQDKLANTFYLSKGFFASCLLNCNNITYRQDPTALMTNNGHDFMFNCKDFGTSSVITCISHLTGTPHDDNATIMMLSTSSTTPLVTDTGCGGGSGSGQITTGGLADIAGTFTAGTASAGSVTSTLAHTWTAAETDSNVQNQCVNTELHTGSHIILVYSFTFGPVSLVSGNTLQITDSLTAT